MNHTLPDNSALLTIQQAANILGVSTKTLRRWDAAGRFVPKRTSGNQRRYSRDQVEEYRKKRETPFGIPLALSADHLKGASSPLRQGFEGQAVHLSVDVTAGPLSGHSGEVDASTDSRISPLHDEGDSGQARLAGASAKRARMTLGRPSFLKVSLLAFCICILIGLSTLFLLQKMGREDVVVAVKEYIYPNVILSAAKNLINPTSRQVGTQDDIGRGQVLQAATTDNSLFFNVNIPSRFAENTEFLRGISAVEIATLSGGIITNNADVNAGTGILTASNVIYSVAAGTGITITTGQAPTITNSDLGSAQNIFKTIKVGGDSFSTGSNSDTLELAAGSNITLSTDTSNKKVTITGASPTSGGWTDDGTTVRLTTSTDSVGIGTTSPSTKLHVVGNVTFSGTTSLNGVTYTWPSADGSADYLLTTDGSGTLSWVASAGTINFWQRNSGALSPFNITDDILLGATSTTSAKFGLINIAGGTPTATISANSGNNATYLTGAGSLQTTNRQTLTLGGSTTGLVQVANTSGSVFSTFDTVNSRLGIGTASPTDLLTLRSDSAGATADVLRLENLGTATADTALGINFYANRTTSGSTNFAAIDASIISIDATNYAGKFDFLVAQNGSLSTIATFGNPNIEFNAPIAVTTGGDVGIDYDLQFLNTGMSNITSEGPLSILAGDANHAENLTLGTQGTGDVIIDINDSVAAGGLKVLGSSGYVFNVNPAGKVGIGATSPLASLDIRPNITDGGTIAVASASGATSFAALIADNTGVGDIFTASKSGATKFTILNNGNLSFAGTTNILSTLASAATAARTWTFPNETGTFCIQNSSNCGFAIGSTTNWWDSTNGALYPVNSTLDLLIGGQATTSAKFAVLNVDSGTPTATISANSGNNATTLTGTGVLGTTNAQTLTLGNSTTGNIAVSANSGVNNAFNITDGTNAYLTLDTRTTNSGTSALTLAAGTAPTIASAASVDYTTFTVTPPTITLTGTTTVNSVMDSILFNAPTITDSSAVTIDRASTLTISGPPQAAGSAIITYPFSLFVDGGITKLEGTLRADLICDRNGSNCRDLRDTRWSRLSGDGTVSSSVKIASGTNGGPTLADSVKFGHSASSIGDLNGDGIEDMAVGSIADPTGGSLRGAVYVLFMNRDGTVSSSVKIASGTNGGPTLADSDLFGSSASSIGDLNGDGIEDMVVGAPVDDTGGTERGAAYVVFMSRNNIYFATQNVGIGTALPLASLDIRPNLIGGGTIAIASASGSTSFAAMVVDNNGVGDIFTASKSGETKFLIRNNGLTALSMNGTATAFALCHSGTDLDAASNELRDVVPCTDAPGDLAEWYEVKGEGEAGDIMAVSDELFSYQATQIDPYTGQILPQKKTTTIAKLERASAEQNKIVGIISSSPWRVMGGDVRDQGINPKPIAVSGRTSVKVSTENGFIQPGDFLTTSSTPGVAMKATRAGQVIGKALEGFNPSTGHSTLRDEPSGSDLKSSGQVGKIMVFVNLTWHDPNVYIAADGNLVGVNQESRIKNQELVSSPMIHDSSFMIQDGNSTDSAQATFDLGSDQLFKDLSDKVALLESRINNLYDTTLSASSSALLVSSVIPSVAKDLDSSVASLLQNDNAATISGTLAVLGRTTLTDLGVTGNINAGLLSINGLEGEIYTLAGDLKLQPKGLGGIDILAGKIIIDTKGNMIVAGTVTAEAVEAEEFVVKGKDSIGTATIPIGAREIEVTTPIATSTSKIFLTATTNTTSPLTVSSKSNGRFRVAVVAPQPTPVTFDWWVVGTRE